MKYRVQHQTAYEYGDSVTLSHHVLRLKPRDLARQKCLWHEFKVEPTPLILRTEPDYFGNEQTFLSIQTPHGRFMVDSTFEIEVALLPPPDPSKTMPWELVRTRLRETPREGELDAFEYLYDSPYIPTSDELAAYAMPSFAPGRPLLAAVLDLTRRIFEEFKFDSTATTVATPPSEVLKIKRGVCQDFAHLEVGCLRSIGLSARYVSGYLETEPPPGKPKLAGADVSHAWISVFCPSVGWVDVDPTNNILASEHHITIGWGRDYGDVSPIRGVLLGGGTHSLSVGVDVVRIEIEIPLKAAEVPVESVAIPAPSQSQSQSQVQA